MALGIGALSFVEFALSFKFVPKPPPKKRKNYNKTNIRPQKSKAKGRWLAVSTSVGEDAYAAVGTGA